MLKLVIGSMTGLGAHQLNTVFDAWERDGTPRNWILIARYGIGVLIILPIFILIKSEKPNSTETDDIGAYLMAALSVGCGVTAGYLLDGLKE